mmetsp:Transcript_4154/g.16494  ORF Transcript_4154/g.16494 Transcript_4154/m.16494 type:complete len:380 (-) Transcript_4154:1044-2183(-)
MATTRHAVSVARFHTTRPAGYVAASRGSPATNARPETRVLVLVSVSVSASRSTAPPNLGGANARRFWHVSGSQTTTSSLAVAYSEPSCENAPAVSGGGGMPACVTPERHRQPARSPPRAVADGTHILASPSADVVHAIARNPPSSLAEPRTETEVTAPACGASHTHTHVNPTRKGSLPSTSPLKRSAERLPSVAASRVQMRSVSSGARSASARCAAPPRAGNGRSLRRSTVTKMDPSWENAAWLTYGSMGSSGPPSPLTRLRGATARSATCASCAASKSCNDAPLAASATSFDRGSIPTKGGGCVESAFPATIARAVSLRNEGFWRMSGAGRTPRATLSTARLASDTTRIALSPCAAATRAWSSGKQHRCVISAPSRGR